MPASRLPRRTTQNVKWFPRFILPLPDFCVDILYHRLLDNWLAEHPAIAENLVWESPSGLLPYSDWPTARKDQLRRAFPFAYPFQLEDPPPNMMMLADGDLPITVLSEDHAWQLYLNHVAQSLANDFWSAFNWSLSNYDATGLQILLHSRSFFIWDAQKGGYQVGWQRYPPLGGGDVLPAPPDVTFKFLSDNNLILFNRRATIDDLLHWCRNNLVHFRGALEAKNMEYQWQYRGLPPISRVLAGTLNTDPAGPDNVLRHRTAGCHGTNGFLTAVLRVVNIPVQYTSPSNTGHATPAFISERMYLSHGDDPYSAHCRATPPFPAGELLIDQDKYDAWFSPNLSADVRTSNIGRQARELDLKYISDYLVHKHCDDLAAGRSHDQSDVYRTFERWYTVAELEAMYLWQRLDGKVASFGGCDFIP